MTTPIRNPAIFASAFAPHIGGVEELSRQLAIHQASRGMTPTVVTMLWPKTLPAAEVIDGIQVYRHVFRVPEPRPRYLAGWAATSRQIHRRIYAELAARETDLIHVQCVSGNARYAGCSARRLDVPLVVSMQGELTMDATGLYERSSQQRRAWRQLLDAADVVTGCSQAVLDDAASEYAGAWQQRATVVPNGVRPTDFTTASHLQHPRPYVLGIGRMVPQKGFDVLIRAFASLATPADLDLILAGDGPSRAELEALVAQLDLTTRVRFLGPIGREDAAAAFRGASAFVLASRREPQGIVILEAMAAETPVVATRVGGVPETVAHEVNGLLVETGNIEQLARAIERLVSDSTLNLRIRREGLITAARHDWRAITSAYSEVYESARNTRLARRPQ